MAYYRVCPYCGCNLDPGERCDCQIQREKRPTIKRKPQHSAATMIARTDAVKTMALAAKAKRT